MVFCISNYKLLRVYYQQLEIVEGVCKVDLVSSSSKQDLFDCDISGLLI